MQFRAVKGMNDILPDEVGRWQRLERAFRRVVELYGYREVRTPMLESTELFVRSIGETTEVVEKQMFVLERGDESLALRPEGTAGAARAYVVNSQHAKEPVSRWYYIGPMFRAERPQRGRLRQFHQAGCEIFGDPGPICDAEMIDMLYGFLKGVGIADVKVCINSLGGSGTRTRYRDVLLEYLRPRTEQLSPHAQKRLEDNPLRILDSKDPRDREAVADAPSILDVLAPEDVEHWNGLKRALDALGTPYEVTPSLVRGLDYYTRTLFEFQSNMGELGSQNTLLGGGRYDGMVKALGGPQVPAIGFATGMERLLLALGEMPLPKEALCFVAPIGERAIYDSLKLVRELRDRDVRVELDGRGNSPKSMLRRADALGARVVVLIGDSELDQGIVQLKDLITGTQDQVPRADAVQRIATLFEQAGAPNEGTR
jgi:histidyl-tRNA synthetase